MHDLQKTKTMIPWHLSRVFSLKTSLSSMSPPSIKLPNVLKLWTKAPGTWWNPPLRYPVVMVGTMEPSTKKPWEMKWKGLENRESLSNSKNMSHFVWWFSFDVMGSWGMDKNLISFRNMKWATCDIEDPLLSLVPITFVSPCLSSFSRVDFFQFLCGCRRRLTPSQINLISYPLTLLCQPPSFTLSPPPGPPDKKKN